MDIIKHLSLNRTPKDVLNGSIICAKNMMVDDTGSFLTNDIGFKALTFTIQGVDGTYEAFDGERIVGVIPCNNEIVILTVDNDSGNSHIYRKFDYESELKEVMNSWEYSGGHIEGTYTYNYKNELVLTIAESGENIDVPLKSFTIKENPNVTADRYPYYTEIGISYATEEIIPEYNCSYSIDYNGSLVCGVYTFFIRFLINDYDKTRWFQISSDIIITHEVLSKDYTHRYLNSSDTLADTVHESKFPVNSDSISNKNINLYITLSDNKLEKYEIGYIIKRKSDVQGRIHGVYTSDKNTIVSISSNNYLAEVGIDELLEAPHQFFNVKNVINYNNRLYVSNYKEYPVEDLTQYAKQIRIGVDKGRVEESQQANSVGSTYTIDLEIAVTQDFNPEKHPYVGGPPRSIRTNEITFYNLAVDSLTGAVIHPEYVIEEYKNVLFITSDTSTIYYLNGLRKQRSGIDEQHVFNLYWFLQDEEDYNDAICIASYIGKDSIDPPPSNWDWDFGVKTCDICVENNNGIYDLYVKYNDKKYYLTGENIANSCILAYTRDDLGVIEEAYLGVAYSSSLTSIRINRFTKGNPLPNVISSKIQNTGSGGYIDPTDDEGSQSGGITTIPKGANLRSLIPKQIYNFFIHYIRQDGSSTQGYHIGSASFDISEFGNIIVPVFDNIEQPSSKYIGFFISYEDVERNCTCAYVTENVNGKQKITNALYLYDIETPRFSKIYIGNDVVDIDSNLVKYVENRLTYNHIEIDPKIDNNVDIPVLLSRKLENQYNSENKILYRLTRNIYEWYPNDVSGVIKVVKDEDYLPDFYNRQVLISYTGADGFIIDPAVPYVFKFDGTSATSGVKTTYSVDYDFAKLYSPCPTEAMNIKEDFTYIATQISYETPNALNPSENDKVDSVYVNCVIRPDKLHDFLELQACYRSKPSVMYSNYKSNYISTFDKTVYRSDVISDESLVNRFRHFTATDYKNILENKGKITNIVGIGLYLIVHTEYSMFVFDRSPKLTSKYQMNVPDTFDVDYQEVMPSNEGFGGLKNKEESILSKNGYIWFDRTNGIIFNYVNGKAAILSGDINNFIKYVGVDTIRFAEDIIHNRIIICIKDYEGKYSTISYSFYTNSFISLHDYKFTNNYRTYNKSYMFDETYNNVLFEFDDDSIADYKQLQLSSNSSLYPTLKTGNKYHSYVDVIFNEAYETSKVLNSIEYTLNEIRNKFIDTILSEEQLYRRFSGDRIRIYTDETDSGVLNIHVPTTNEIGDRNQGYNDENLNIVDEYSSPISPLEGYKYPVFEKGVWFLNYFRNYLVSENPYDSDEKTLIHGKYFVIRFIFNNDRKVKLDTLDVNVNPY